MRQAGLDGRRQITKSGELLFQRFGACPLRRRVALGRDRGGHSVFMLLPEHLLAVGALASQYGHLCAQFLCLLPRPVDFGVRTILDCACMLLQGVPLLRGQMALFGETGLGGGQGLLQMCATPGQGLALR